MFRKKLHLLILIISSLAIAQRVCLSPDSLFVDSSSMRSLNLFIYVPPTTTSFKIGIYDQVDEEEPIGQPSSFILYPPEGSPAQKLEAPRQGDWSDYEVRVDGRWGIWRLGITGPKSLSQERRVVRNYFLVRTVGDVDLYVKLEPRARIWFSPPRFGNPPTHNFTMQVPPLNRFRLNLIRPPEEETVKVQLEAPRGVKFEEKWGGLQRGAPEFLEVRGGNLKGKWRLTVKDVKGDYALGIEQELRLFFSDSPLMETKDILLKTVSEDGKTPLPARVDITSPQTSLESYVVYTDNKGSSYISLLPNALYQLTISRGFEYEPHNLLLTAEVGGVTIPLSKRIHRLKGWYCGDTHMHTIYSDGNDTPLQMAEAGQGEGLDWIVLTDHGAGENIQHIFTANHEGIQLSQPGKFLVIPGEEFSAPQYHANIINGTVSESNTVSLNRLVRSVRKMNTPLHPLAIKLNHPYWNGTPKAPDIARETPLLPLIELWNADPPNESRSHYLLWELLNQGRKVFGDTATDTHNRKTSKVGARRTYVYLGDLPLTTDNVTRALLNGHSFLSRGALLFFSLEEKIPGEEAVINKGSKAKVKIEVESISPIDHIELVNNGKVLHTISVGGAKRFSAELMLTFEEGWVIAQALEKGTASLLAMTNPVFIRGR